MSELEIRRGLPLGREAEAARLYDRAFGAKMRALVPDEAKRRAMLADCFVHDLAFAAVMEGEVVGLAGFHEGDRSFTSAGGAGLLFRHLGVFGGLRALVGFVMFDRSPEAGELLMDGIAVDPRCQGQGVGTRLLRALFAHAAEAGLTSVRLDVVDTNPRARALYDREGFVAGEVSRDGWLTRRLFGFDTATTMRKAISAAER